MCELICECGHSITEHGGENETGRCEMCECNHFILEFEVGGEG